MKKRLLIILIFFLFLFGIFFLLLNLNKKKTQLSLGTSSNSLSEQGKFRTLSIFDLPVEERPYIALWPSSDGHWITLNVDNIKNSEKIEYEIVYEMTVESEEGNKRIEQGITSEVSVKGNSYNSGKRLFGSESAGKYKYDKDVEGKRLLIRLRNPSEVIKYETEWVIKNGGKELVSPDSKFSLKGNLPKDFFVILMTGGIPAPVEGEIIGGPYGVFSSGQMKLSEAAIITFSIGSVPEKVRVLVWDSKTISWEELNNDLRIENGEVSVKTNKLGTFVVVRP